MYTESHSLAIHTETTEVMQGVAVNGEEKKLLYMGDTEFLNM